MATVYLAREHDSSPGNTREVALKLTHAHLRQEKPFARHLIEEAKLAAGIHHPNVVAVLDVGDDPLGIYLVMDYVDGDTLGNLHRLALKENARLSLRSGMRVLLDALAGLHAAHELSNADGGSLNLVHRDFTPQNILVGLDGSARLTDFGIAKAATSLGHTATGIVKGKIAYMSPEQARGKPLDRRADVFSAGVIAWELVAGRRLHDSDTDVSLLLRVVSEQAPPLSTIVPGVPADLERAIASALRLDRERRCPSANQLADDLRVACTNAGLLGDRLEVASEVHRLLGSKLEKRRRRVAESLALRARRSALAAETELSDPPTPSGQCLPSSRRAPSETPIPGSWRPPPLATPLPDDIPTLQSDPSVRSFAESTAKHEHKGTPPAKGFPVRIGVAIAVGAALALAVIVPMAWKVAGNDDPIEEPGANPASPAVSSAHAAAPKSSTPPAPSAVPDAAPSRRVRVSANAKIARVAVGDREVAIAEPTATVEVELLPDEQDEMQTLYATALDGRVMKARLEPRQARVMIRFGDRTVVGAPTETTPPLAPNPYSH